MLSLLRETVFGRIVRLVTQKRTLRYDEEVDPAACFSFLAEPHDKAGAPSDHSSRKKSDSEEEEAGAELGDKRRNETSEGNESNPIIVDWYGPGDEGEAFESLSWNHGILTLECRESSELVIREEDLRYVPNLPPDDSYLLGLVDIYACCPQRRRNIRCLKCCISSRPYALHPRIRSVSFSQLLPNISFR